MCTVKQSLLKATLAVFLAASVAAFPSAHSQNDLGYFEKGLQAETNGDYVKALSIWEESTTEMQEPDFRIAHSYINLVADKKLKQHYVKASEIYKWGLKGAIDSSEEPFLIKELNYIRPIIGNGKYRDIKKAVDNEDSDALRSIAKFWDSIDPTPMTPYNERLLEHWERVKFAKENFMKKNSGEFDDRGFVYIKFGEPFFNKKGQLNYLSSTVTRLVKEGVETPSFATADQLAINSTQRLNMETRVRQYHNYPRYEIWIYGRLNDEPQNIIYMFGTRDATSSFRKIHSVEDFIPSEAYRTHGQNSYSFSSGSFQQNQGENTREQARVNTLRSSQVKTPQIDFSPALILQLMYYQQFAALDAYFGNSYNEMMNRFVSRSDTRRKGLAREFGTMYGSKLRQIESKAPDQVSVYENKLMDMPGKYYAYRFLDKNNNPSLKLFSVLSLEDAAYYDLLKETNSLQTGGNNRYVVNSGYELRNESGEKAYEKTDQNKLQSLNMFSKVLDIPYQNTSQSVIISHELHNTGDLGGSEIAAESTYLKSLKGLSNHRLNMPEPLTGNQLMMSDLIIGYSYSNTQQARPALPESLINFTIAHDRVIPQGSELNIFYELYMLSRQSDDGLAEYSFQYSIKEEKRGFLGLGKRSDNQQNSITVNNSVANTRDTNSININTSEYETGNYELFIEITDINSGSTYAKNLTFSIR